MGKTNRLRRGAIEDMADFLDASGICDWERVNANLEMDTCDWPIVINDADKASGDNDIVSVIHAADPEDRDHDAQSDREVLATMMLLAQEAFATATMLAKQLDGAGNAANDEALSEAESFFDWFLSHQTKGRGMEPSDFFRETGERRARENRERSTRLSTLADTWKELGHEDRDAFLRFVVSSSPDHAVDNVTLHVPEVRAADVVERALRCIPTDRLLSGEQMNELGEWHEALRLLIDAATGPDPDNRWDSGGWLAMVMPENEPRQTFGATNFGDSNWAKWGGSARNADAAARSILRRQFAVTFEKWSMYVASSLAEEKEGK